MTSYLNPRVLDLGLNVLDVEATHLYLCSDLPATYTNAVTDYALGNKSGISIGSPVDRSPSGRKVTLAAIVSGSPGTVTASGTATHYAITDNTNSRLLAAGPISNPQALTNGNTFILGAVDIGIPGPS